MRVIQQIPQHSLGWILRGLADHLPNLWFCCRGPGEAVGHHPGLAALPWHVLGIDVALQVGGQYVKSSDKPEADRSPLEDLFSQPKKTLVLSTPRTI